MNAGSHQTGGVHEARSGAGRALSMLHGQVRRQLELLSQQQDELLEQARAMDSRSVAMQEQQRQLNAREAQLNTRAEQLQLQSNDLDRLERELLHQQEAAEQELQQRSAELDLQAAQQVGSQQGFQAVTASHLLSCWASL